MHKFMKAIGFSNCYTKRQLDEMIKDVMQRPDYEIAVTDSLGRRIFQSQKAYGAGIGISLIGEIDKRGFRTVLFAYPYVKGEEVTVEEEIQIQKLADKDAYAGISEDYNVGISLIFYVLNIAKMTECLAMQERMNFQKVQLSALSVNGMILFGVEKSKVQLNKEMESQTNRNALIQEARNGDMDAMENLTLNDIDLYSYISKRAAKEDVYSIVDTTFLPYGVESDQYTIVGHILRVEQVENEKTKELVYVLTLQCNNLHFKVAINEQDLLGEPKEGRRCKGDIWMLGEVLMEPSRLA